MGFVKLLLDHVGLPLVVILAVHLVIFGWMGQGDHPKTFLLKALCCLYFYPIQKRIIIA